MAEQNQRAGESAMLVQAGRDILVGLNYDQARQIAIDVFKANFLELSSDAAKTATARAREFIDDYLKIQEARKPEAIQGANEPGFQQALFNAEKAYAITGSKDLKEVLIDVLADRASETTRGLMQIVLEESIATAPKLTSDQFDVLSLVFLLRYTVNFGITNSSEFGEYCDAHLKPFFNGLSKQAACYQHLEYSNCAAVGIGSMEIIDVLRRRYSGIFATGFTNEELGQLGIEGIDKVVMPCMRAPEKLQFLWINSNTFQSLCGELNYDEATKEKIGTFEKNYLMKNGDLEREIISQRDWMGELLEFWRGCPIKQLTLTSVGIALAHANLRRKTGQDFDLTIWIK